MLYSLLTLTGRHASTALPVGLVLGLAVPSFASALKPLLVLSLIVPLVIALARIDWQEQYNHLKHWQLMIAVCIWVLLVCPLAMWGCLVLLESRHPEIASLTIATVVAAAAPPVTACAAIALFLRLDAAIVIVTTVLTMVLVPLTLPPLALELLDITITVSLFELSGRLAAFIFAAFALALVVKNVLGKRHIERHLEMIDGIAVIFITCFIIGIMDGVTEVIFKQPWYALLTLLISFGFILFLQGISAAVFWSLPRKTCLAIAMMSGNCNLGLMYLVLSDQFSIDVLLFYSIGQIPMYLLPALQTPLYRHLLSNK
jgi:BASS family bile acid:Na+ symporter